ncbi:hypothetical protein Tco_0148909 [Tanacetum coccineum]
MVAATEPKTIQKVMQIFGALTDEAVRNGSIKKVEKRGNMRNLARIRMEERIWVLGPSVLPATPTMHPKGLVGHVATVTARVIWQRIVEAYRGMLILSMLETQLLGHAMSVVVTTMLGENDPEEKMRQLKSAKAKEKEQKEIKVVRDFLEVFPDDLFGLSPVWEIEFQIELIPRATPVAKSPYRLTPSELKELSGKLKEI